ncbi:MAG TPA: hypothetical protein VGM76_14480 [Lacipirellulaceae bacterium]|jgi:hypothetical protein
MGEQQVHIFVVDDSVAVEVAVGKPGAVVGLSNRLDRKKVRSCLSPSNSSGRPNLGAAKNGVMYLTLRYDTKKLPASAALRKVELPSVIIQIALPG